MDIATDVRELLTHNTQQVERDGHTYTFTVPSTTSYPFQWLWDSCFHAIVWTHFDVPRAQEELRSLLSAQQENGFLPHILYWDQAKVRRSPLWYHWQESRGFWSMVPGTGKPATSSQTQPPILAQAVARIDAVAKDRHAFLREVLPKLDALYHWWHQARDPDGDHLVTIISQYESGLDALPAYDAVIGYHGRGALRYLLASRRIPTINKTFFAYHPRRTVAYGPFHVEDVFLNTLYALNLDVLADLHERVDDHQGAARWREESRAVGTALVKKCWDEARSAFFNLDGRREHRSTILTIASLMPLVLPWLEQGIVEALVERHILNEKEFWLAFPVPSVAATEPTFSPDSSISPNWKPFHWRGSTWMNTNWYLIHGLRAHGYEEIADHIADRSREMVERSGLREYYNPVTAKGLSAKGFGWSTLVLDL